MPGSRVGVCLLTSMELPICILAVLKIGATYVPLDPNDPPLRRADMIRASSTTAVVGQRLQRASVANVPVHLIDVDAGLAHDGQGIQPTSAGPPASADTTACIAFISGSDDASRVVNISHRNLSNLIYSMAKRPGVGDRDVVVASSPITASRAAFEMFLPLITGARLVVAADKDLLTGRALLALLQRTGATIMYGAPHVWTALLEANWIGYPTLKMLCSATELSPRLTERLSAIDGELWSLYGQPEAGIWSTIRLIKPKEASSSGLGQPIANSTLHVLDSSLRPAPVGAIGGLYIGGDGLTETALAVSIVNESGVRLYPHRRVGPPAGHRSKSNIWGARMRVSPVGDARSFRRKSSRCCCVIRRSRKPPWST